MAIVRWDPFAEMSNLTRNMDRLFDAAGWRPYPFGSLEVETFPIDMYEKNDELVVKASLPGVKAEDLDLQVTGDSMTIRAQTRTEEEVDEEHYYRRERRAGHWQRVVQLPGHLTADKAEASFQDGVLTIRIPKAEEARPKQIKVRADGK
jgi:HSP20 family protein